MDLGERAPGMCAGVLALSTTKLPVSGSMSLPSHAPGLQPPLCILQPVPHRPLLTYLCCLLSLYASDTFGIDLGVIALYKLTATM
jgi:hypothetical protein